MFATINVWIDCLSDYGAPKALKGGIFLCGAQKKTPFRTSGTLCVTDDGTCFSIEEKLDLSE